VKPIAKVAGVVALAAIVFGASELSRDSDNPDWAVRTLATAAALPEEQDRRSSTAPRTPDGWVAPAAAAAPANGDPPGEPRIMTAALRATEESARAAEAPPPTAAPADDPAVQLTPAVAPANLAAASQPAATAALPAAPRKQTTAIRPAPRQQAAAPPVRAKRIAARQPPRARMVRTAARPRLRVATRQSRCGAQGCYPGFSKRDLPSRRAPVQFRLADRGGG
jgi:hypothetical protein